MTSRCSYTHGAVLRIKYSNELIEAGLSLDRFGKCFPQAKKIPRTETRSVIQKYKFYMAFENSLHCTDYITEKLWDNAYQSDTVPVIWGAPKADITAAVPLDSFIHADDFNSAKELPQLLG